MHASLLILLALAAVAAAEPTAAHGWKPWPKYSRLDAAGRYLPVTWNDRYTMYRFNVTLEVVFSDMYDADPSKPSLLSTVATGNVKDTFTGATVGSWDQTTTIVHAPGPGAPISIVLDMMLELGPAKDDVLVIEGGYEAASGTQLADWDVPVVGGSGQYLGAVGDTVVSPGNVQQALVTLWVPRLPRF